MRRALALSLSGSLVGASALQCLLLFAACGGRIGQSIGEGDAAGIYHGEGRGSGGDGSSFNTKYFHFLAFPTDPVVKPYSP